ncbi:MAG TPA: hypothetical protein VFO86_09235, partial [Terriglobia bacterium]|nr:hypothetical protein [Terriglobia bacterium]
LFSAGYRWGTSGSLFDQVGTYFSIQGKLLAVENSVLKMVAKGLENARLTAWRNFKMGNWIHNPKAESADFVPAEDRIVGTVAATEYDEAVACLHGIMELSPRTAHQIMRKIVGVYRNLATIADIDWDCLGATAGVQADDANPAGSNSHATRRIDDQY